MRSHRWIGTLAFVASTAAAQAPAAPAAMPDGWTAHMDQSSMKVEDAHFVAMGPGMHVTSGAVAGVFYNAKNVSKGAPFSFGASFGQRKAPDHPEAYGLFWGGEKLDTKDPSYLYFLVRGDGKFMVSHRANATEVHSITDWTENAAINKADPAKNGAASNALEVRVAADSVRMFVNGKQVIAYAAKTMGNGAGTYGVRVNHFLDVHIGNFGAK